MPLDRKKIEYLILACMAVFILFNGSLFSLVSDRLELRKLDKKSSELDKEYVRLAAELDRLNKGDTKYLEEIARGKYHMSKEGETEFRF